METTKKPLADQVAEAQQDLAASMAAESDYSEQSRYHLAEAYNTELSLRQREMHQLAHIQFAGQYRGQQNETNHLYAQVLRLKRQEQEERELEALSDLELLARLKRTQPYVMPSDMAMAMDETAGV